MDSSRKAPLIGRVAYATIVMASTLPVLTPPSSAIAWGSEGHQIIALIAAHELTPAASKAAQDLLEGSDTASAMASASTWADEVRSIRPETAPWHYVNIEVGSAGYNAIRDCPNDDCVVAQIERDEQIISDKALLPAVRAEALKFLIHFVGDIHQPLHAADDHDRGGNDIRIIYNGTTMNMHALWDKDMVEQFGDEPASIALKLDSTINPTVRAELQSGSPADWANESFRVSKSEVYAQYHAGRGSDAPIVIPASYVSGEQSVVSKQLISAGVRLASILNKTWP